MAIGTKLRTLPVSGRVTMRDLLMEEQRRVHITKAAIVTCGGLCPGINAVLADLAGHLKAAGAEVLGVKDGFRGFYEDGIVPWQWGKERNSGGSALKVARGGWSLDRIKQGILASGFDALFAIGGDGTHRGLTVLSEALPSTISVVGIPKTIDNDVFGFDRCFGFDTAVSEAVRAVRAACIEARSVDRGLGVVKLMGRHSGHIALAACIAHGEVDICLLPEVPFSLAKVLEHVAALLAQQRKCVIVIAEGSGFSLIDHSLGSSAKDPSGNPILPDIAGLFLQQAKDLNAVVKYIDPSYMLRGGPPVSSDLHLCAELALCAVLGCKAGYTAFSVGPVGGQIALLSLSYISKEEKGGWRGGRKVENADQLLKMYLRQPSFR